METVGIVTIDFEDLCVPKNLFRFNYRFFEFVQSFAYKVINQWGGRGIIS